MMLYDAEVVGSDETRAVQRLAAEHPDWITVLEAAIAVASRSGSGGEEFAGSSVLQELESRAGHRQWFPNLRLLVTYGILEKSGETTRGGRRAYYRFVNHLATGAALDLVRGSMASRPKPALSFIGVGESSGTRDTARRSGDMRFEPRSWR
jgi:hypothetical protein